MSHELLKSAMSIGCTCPSWAAISNKERCGFTTFFLSKAITFILLYNIITHINATNVQFVSGPDLQKLKSTWPGSSTGFRKIALRV